MERFRVMRDTRQQRIVSLLPNSLPDSALCSKEWYPTAGKETGFMRNRARSKWHATMLSRSRDGLGLHPTPPPISDLGGVALLHGLDAGPHRRCDATLLLLPGANSVRRAWRGNAG